MTSLRTALAHRRSVRAQLRQERSLTLAMVSAPTVESAHEIATLAARR